MEKKKEEENSHLLYSPFKINTIDGVSEEIPHESVNA